MSNAIRHLKWSAWGDLHSQGCSGLSRTGLLFPVNHTPWSAPRDLHPEGSAILSRRGLLFPLKPGAANWRSRQDSHLQPGRSKRRALVIELREHE